MSVICQTCLSQIAAHAMIDREGCRVWWRGVDVGLTTGEFRIIARLIEKSPCFCGYQELYDTLRQRPGFHCASMHANVRSAIKRLRKKFQAVDPGFDGIVNFVGYGYRWTPDGPVDRQKTMSEIERLRAENERLRRLLAQVVLAQANDDLEERAHG